MSAVTILLVSLSGCGGGSSGEDEYTTLNQNFESGPVITNINEDDLLPLSEGIWVVSSKSNASFESADHVYSAYPYIIDIEGDLVRLDTKERVRNNIPFSVNWRYGIIPAT